MSGLAAFLDVIGIPVQLTLFHYICSGCGEIPGDPWGCDYTWLWEIVYDV